MNATTLASIFLFVFAVAFVFFLCWDHRFEFAKDDGHYGCMTPYMFEGIVFNSSISDKYKKPKHRYNCSPVKPQDVEVLGIIFTQHKTGTVFHKDFYQSISAHMGINFVYLDKLPISVTQRQSSYLSLNQAHIQHDSCQDYHKCNDRAIVQTKLSDINQACKNSGIQCDDWFDIECFARQCAELIKIHPTQKIITPIRNPFDLVISAYLYHSGYAHEKWAREIPMRKLGFGFSPEINNLTVNEALNNLNPEIGLEISFQIVSDVLKNMLLLSELEKVQNNVKSFQFENIMRDYHATMAAQLDFLGIFKQEDKQKEKNSVTEYGEWVMSDKHKVQLNRVSHITANQKVSKKFLKSIVNKHRRAEQLNRIAVKLGYENIKLVEF